MLTQDTYREANRRSHRLLGHYLALTAWIRGVDCVAVVKDELFPFLGLKKRMEMERIKWLTEDAKPLFPYSWWTQSKKTGGYSTLFLSRLRFPKDARLGFLVNEDRIKQFEAAGLKGSLIELPTEAEMVRLLSSAMVGLEPFTPK